MRLILFSGILLLASCGNTKQNTTVDSTAGTSSVQAAATDTNFVDAAGLKQGYWIITGQMQQASGYSPSAKVKEGMYKDNNREGMWKEYYPEGALKTEGEYVKGKKAGRWFEYDKSGKRTGEIVYPDAQ